MQIVFVHGWGMSPDIWRDVQNRFPDSVALDLGFIGDLKQAEVDQDAVFVTHSVGTVYALKHFKSHIKGFIAINGFKSFKRFADEETLSAISNALGKDADLYMSQFWRRCGWKQRFEGTLNKERLQEGLTWLAEWEENIADNIPVLALAGTKDRVAPLVDMKKEWSDTPMRVAEGGGHVLPLTHAEWCIQHIEQFLDERNLERKSL
ncbi:MAG: hypothetical protein GC137_00910 [Alphaproteobacteria bacterium]|nr:hypothetical protein [Alphaproteobacteria bacterium]